MKIDYYLLWNYLGAIVLGNLMVIMNLKRLGIL